MTYYNEQVKQAIRRRADLTPEQLKLLGYKPSDIRAVLDKTISKVKRFLISPSEIFFL